MSGTTRLGTLFGLPSVLIYVFTDGRLPATAFGIPFSYGRRANVILKQPLLSHRMPICLIGVARSERFERSLTEVRSLPHYPDYANRAYNKLTDKVFSIGRHGIERGLELP